MRTGWETLAVSVFIFIESLFTGTWVASFCIYTFSIFLTSTFRLHTFVDINTNVWSDFEIFHLRFKIMKFFREKVFFVTCVFEPKANPGLQEHWKVISSLQRSSIHGVQTEFSPQYAKSQGFSLFSLSLRLSKKINEKYYSKNSTELKLFETNLNFNQLLT